MNHIDASVMHEEMSRTIAEWKARAEKAEAARDIWKSKLDVCLEQGRQVLERAERAESEVRRWERLERSRWDAGAVPHGVAARFAKHALRYRADLAMEKVTTGHLVAERDALKTACAKVMEDVARVQTRAERAEALLREVAVVLKKLASGATYFERDDAIGLNVVQLDTPIGIAKDAFAKVRDLLEGKT